MLAMLRLRKLIAVVLNPEARRVFLRSGIAPSVELDPLLRPLTADVVIDVGANGGQFTALALMRLRPRRVIAFEPLAGPALRFARAFGDDTRVLLHRTAVGAAHGRAEMHVARASDSSSLLHISPRQVSTFPGTEEIGVETVSVQPLGQVLELEDLTGRCLLKIDVQGYELNVLRGCEESLDRFDHILVELSFVELYEGQPLAPEVIAWLYERGFKTVGVGATSTIQTDFLFTRLPAAAPARGRGLRS